MAGLLFAGLVLAQAAAPAPSFSAGPVLDSIIEEAIRSDQIPGAVVTIGHEGRVVYQKAYGLRALIPKREPMTLDTVFDIASLTKVVATTTSIAKLIELGKVRLNDRITQYIPEYQGGKTDITVRSLLTHFSGLRPDVDLEPEWSGYETGIRLAISDRPTASPGTRFVYSDINFLLLGEIVRRASGEALPQFAQKFIFRPLGMSDTMYQPARSVVPRIAPTEIVKGSTEPLRGVVHDPTTRFMGGVAGHAGLFSTASDLSKFAEMILNGGERQGVRVLSPLTIRAFTTVQTPPGQPILRGLGWDIDSPYSGNRGDLFPIGSFGHTGFTGTSLWIDPSTRSYVILLTNAVHPKLRPTITSLRGRVASAAAAGLSVGLPAASVISAESYRDHRPQRVQGRTGAVLNGIDVLVEEGFVSLKGKRVGLITNHTGITRDGKRNIDAMLAGGVNLRAIYSPEHGLAGSEDHENVRNSKDAVSGLPVWSLYSGSNRRPNDEMLKDIDILVFDIQDIGSRFYTYVCTMANAMEEAARRNIQFIVLDRPNPITGTHVEGPRLQADLKSFIGCIDMPVRHGMTVGELAMLYNARNNLKADLRVIKMKDWRRDDWFDSTGLTWVNPSPNMRSLNAALLYPGIGMLEGGKVYSVGRGTDAPFEQIGAAWMNGPLLADYLNGRNIPGIRLYPTRMHPTSSNFAGKTIDGVRFVITDRDVFNSTRFGLELGSALAKLFPGQMTWEANEKLVGSREVVKALAGASDPARIEQEFAADVEEFRRQRSEFLLY